jgi:YesN/AraC family two-component response regulator
MNRNIRVLVVDDHEIVRKVCALSWRRSDIELIGEAKDGVKQ